MDTFTGGAGNDVFNANAVSTANAAITSLNASDVLDGGAGTNTLNLNVTSANNNALVGEVKNIQLVNITGSDNIGATTTTSTSAPAVAAAVAQKITFNVSALAATGTTTVVVNGVTHTTASITIGATAADNIAATRNAIVTVLEKVIGGASGDSGGTVLVEVDTGTIILTSKAAGVALPTITATTLAVGAAAGQIANVTATGASAVSQVLTFTATETGDGYASGDELTLFVDGVARGAISVAADDTATLVAGKVADALNGVFGTGTAVALGAVVTLTAPTPGVALPHISLHESNAIDGGVSIAQTRANVQVGATTTTSTTTNGSIDVDFFGGSTNIKLDGVKTDVVDVVGQKIAFNATTAIANSVAYKAGQTSAAIGFENARGDLTVTGADLKTMNLDGAVRVATAATATTTATAGTIALTGPSGVTALNVGFTSDATLTLTGMTGLKTIDASASTGGIVLSGQPTGALTIKTGAGVDEVTFAAATTANSTSAAALLETNAGNDKITVNVSGTGVARVNAGEGNDSITMTSALNALTFVDGGAGKDTLVVANTTFGAPDYILLGTQVSNVEVLGMSGTVGSLSAGGDANTSATVVSLDASKASQFSELSFRKASSLTNNNYVTKVADAQTVVAAANDVTVYANGYIGKGSTAATTAGLTTTTYAGNLTVNANGGSAHTNDGTRVDVEAYANTVTLNVGPATSGLTQAASYVEMTGDAKSVTVNMTAGANNTKTPTSDIISSAKLVVTTGANTLQANGNTSSAALGAMESIVLAGVGAVTIDNSNSGTATKLATIDASALGGTALYGTSTVGDIVGGLTYTGNLATAETITLGVGADTVTVNSTFAKLDTIVGFDSKKETSTNKSVTDVIVFGGDTLNGDANNEATKVTLSSSATTLELAFIEAAAASGSGDDNTAGSTVFFHFGGDTYLFKDNASGGANTTGQGVLQDGDLAVKVVGLIDFADDWSVFVA